MTADPAPAAFQQLRSIHSSASASKQHPINNSVGGASSTKDRQKQPAHHLESEGYAGVSKHRPKRERGVDDDINTMSFNTLLSAQIAEW